MTINFRRLFVSGKHIWEAYPKSIILYIQQEDVMQSQVQPDGSVKTQCAVYKCFLLVDLWLVLLEFKWEKHNHLFELGAVTHNNIKESDLEILRYGYEDKK